MKAIDRLVQARGGHGSEDLLGSAAMSGVNNLLASALVRALASLDSADIKRVARTLDDQLPASPGLRIAERRLVLAAVTHHFLNPTCKTCHGRGFMVIPDTRKLGDTPCPDCAGQGQVTLDLPGAMGELVKKAQERMDRALGRYDRQLTRKLGKD